MAKEKLICGLDIGNAKVRTVVAQRGENGKPNVIGMGVSPTVGLRKGGVIDVEELINSLTASVEDAERMCGEHITSAFVSVDGHHVKSLSSHGVIAIAHNEIREDDVDRAIDAAQALAMPQNNRILRIIPRSFTVDDQEGIKDPVGMIGTRLEVDAHIVIGSTPQIKNLEKCVHEAGIGIDALIPAHLAAAEAVLGRRQKELGVVVVDIGADSTSIAVFEEGTPIHTATVPVGGNNVTNDIAIGLRTSIDTAEKIKIEFGSTQPNSVSKREQIDLAEISQLDRHTISKYQLSAIIEARVYEIFTMVRDELRKINRDGLLPAGAVLTGGSVKIPGIVDLARETLNLPVQIGFPTDIEGVVDQIDDPAYATALGLILWATRYNIPPAKLQITGAFGFLRDFIKSLLPHS